MSLSQFLKKWSIASVDTRKYPSSDDLNEVAQARGHVPRPGRNGTSSTDGYPAPYPPTSTSPYSGSTTERSTLEAGVREMPLSSLPHAGDGVFMTNLTREPQPGMIPGLGPAPNVHAETWAMVNQSRSDSYLNQRLNVLDDALSAAQKAIAPFQPFIAGAVDDIEKTSIGKVVKEGIEKFFDDMPGFMKALDAVAKLHPFIGVAVLAFKAVYTLEVKRRDNEKKIIALYVEMKDMMGVLLLLKDVRNDRLFSRDGIHIENRLRGLIERTAEDITLCSNVCDTYAKKKLLAKVFQSSRWDEKLLHYVDLFSKRRRKFEFELAIHMARGVDNANAKLDTALDNIYALDEKMNAMAAMFRHLVSPEQKQLSALVDAKGGVRALRNNDKMLLFLEGAASKATNTPSAEGHRAPRAKPGDARLSADDLKNDILEDPDAAAEKNMDVFLRKFEMQKRHIIYELEVIVRREGDRIIEEVKAGPHERIIDKSMHEIWKDMGWRGNVKARHFVLALRDYYLEKLNSESVHGLGPSAFTGAQHPDAWAIKFIDVMRLQPILEAFDDDASGFITIEEMNRFTSSRPIGWSLPHWVAFWAVGYRSSIIDYTNRIESLFTKMEGVRADVLPPNREAIDDYFTYVWEPVHTLTAAALSLQPGPNKPERFQSYLEAEEARLSADLKAVDYIVDGTDTLTLIMGVGRIEKTVFPLLYLLMKRHYEIMRIMRTKIVDSRELWLCVESVLYVYDAIGYRVNDLENIFSQQKLDSEKQFQSFAHGIFKYFHNRKALWSVDYVRSLIPPAIPYNDAGEDQDSKPEDVLKYDYTDDLPLDYWVYDGHSIDDIPTYCNIESPLKDLLGHWHGYFYECEGTRETDGTDSMVTLVLEPGAVDHEVKANGWSNRGRYTVTGSWSLGENGVMEIELKMTFRTAFWAPIFFNGRFDPERDALTGIWDVSTDPENSSGLMEFRRIAPRHLTVYPSIKELLDNKPRAQWKFAIAAVRNDIRRDRWSWSYFSQRRDDRETVISLTIRTLFFGTPPNDEEVQRLRTAVQRLTPADACFYSSMIIRIRAYTWVHSNAWCDSCNGCIGGARLFCLDCENKTTEAYDALDLCSKPECLVSRVTSRDDIEGAHEPNHKLVKVRTVVLKRQHGRAHIAARKAFERVEPICKKIAEVSNQPEKKERTEPNAKAGSEAGDTAQEPGPEIAPDATQAARSSRRILGSELPTCGNCEGPLSFPFWYCIFCSDHLFICDACDRAGVPDVTCRSGPHTEEHHLIRCLAPEKMKEATTSTEQRLTSLEERLDHMQTRFDDLGFRIGNIEQLLYKLAKVADARDSHDYRP